MVSIFNRQRPVPAGELVPDQLVNGLIQESIKKPECSAGFVLDGYPKTLQQAIAVRVLRQHGRNARGPVRSRS